MRPTTSILWMPFARVRIEGISAKGGVELKRP